MKKKVAFIGSGDMARHIAHFMVEDKQYDIAGYFEDFTEVGTIIFDYPILGKINDIETAYKNKIFDELVCAIGYTKMDYRKEMFERFKDLIPFATFKHSSCYIDSTAKIGKGVVILPHSILYLDAVVEDNVFISINSMVTGSIVHKHTYMSASVAMADKTEIGECCNIGIGTTFSGNLKVCDKVRTGAGTVVIKNITEEGTYVGVPARKISNKIN